MKGFYFIDQKKKFAFTKGPVPPGSIKAWAFDEDATTMGAMWRIAIEATALGGDDYQIRRMQAQWQMTEDGLLAFAERCGIVIEKMGAAQGGGEVKWMASFRRYPVGAPPQIKYGVGGTMLGALAQLTQNGAYMQNQRTLVPA